MSQTNVQNRKTIRAGSAKVEIGERLDKMVNIGAGKNISVKETVTTVDIESDNAGVIASLVSEHKMEVSLESLELDLKKYAMARGGLDKVTEYDGKTEIEAVYIVDAGSYENGETIKVPYKNADETDVEVEKVEVVKNGETLPLEETSDYTLVGTNAVTIISLDVESENDSLTITYKHTPKKSIRFATGGGDAKIKPRYIRLTNTDANGNKFCIICPQASISGGLEFPFSSDKAQDVMKSNLTFSATISSSQKPGEQLAWIIDEQAVYTK